MRSCLRRYVSYSMACAAVLLGLWVQAVPCLADTSPQPLLAAFDEVLQQVVTLRQLRPTGVIQRAIRSREQIRSALLALAHEALTPAEWEAERKAMLQWGLIGPEFRLREYVLDLLTEQAAGYYDPKQRMFFIADWLPNLVQKPVMAHELVHALQDQHYDLRANFDQVKDHADLTLARKAVIEGDAVAIMFAYLLEPLGLSLEQLPDMQSLLQAGTALLGEQFQVYTKAPLILRQQLLFPYVHGLSFIKAALARGGWPALEQIYRQPPVSTTQIMHPEKYFTSSPELPGTVRLQVPDEMWSTPWSKIKRDVLGEFLLAVMLQQFLPEDEARQSAAGWRGDRYELFEQPGSAHLSLVSVTAWETVEEAREFFHSYQKVLNLKYPDWTPVAQDEPGSQLWQQGTRAVMLRQQENVVQIVEGVPQTDLPRLRAFLERVSITPGGQP
ncbi:MAG: hypothetical protein AB7N91_16335 [Candidatus Tectimicrobiota bacterium]